MTEQIYVALLDEGTNVWRPVDAEKLPDGTYRILQNLDPAELDEKWEFPPGATVICETHRFASNESGLTAVGLARTSK